MNRRVLELARIAGLYFDAARHMRLKQIAGRGRRLVPVRLLSAGPSPRVAELRPLAAGLGVDRAPQSGPQPRPEEAHAFHGFGSRRPFPTPAFWTDPGDGLLLLFHLHSFADLATYAAGTRTTEGDAFWSAVLNDWLVHCAKPARPAWHPYPTSSRIIAWCAALSAGNWDDNLTERMTISLDRQLRMLRRSVEHDIGGNHVLRNAAALVVGGICLQQPAAKSKGERLLARELAEQVLADGGHEERSTSYQRSVLADLEDVAGLILRTGQEVPPFLSESIARMRKWLTALSGPNGHPPLLNDAWEGPPVGPRPEDPLTDLSASGYMVLRHGTDQIVLDVGPVAPSHLPPHAHADVLSFVLWADGAPLIIDPGSYTYTGPERGSFRSTAAHATVEVDHRDQCEFWGPFRAAHMPNVRRLRFEQCEEFTVVAAEHDGYRRLPDPVIHRRTFCWLPGDGLVVLDRLLAREPHEVSTRLPLAPGVDAAGGDLGPFSLRALGEGPVPTVEARRYAPFLGNVTDAPVVVRRLDPPPGAVFGWALLRPGAEATLEGDRLQVRRRDGRLAAVVAA
jgi:hypothetical protein